MHIRTGIPQIDGERGLSEPNTLALASLTRPSAETHRAVPN